MASGLQGGIRNQEGGILKRKADKKIQRRRSFSKASGQKDERIATQVYGEMSEFGLRSTPGERVGPKRSSWVRIPVSPLLESGGSWMGGIDERRDAASQVLRIPIPGAPRDMGITGWALERLSTPLTPDWEDRTKAASTSCSLRV